jgi:selenocysteine lyase/cysteine desulfurase
MAALPGLVVRDLGLEKSGIISFSVGDVAPDQVAAAMAAAGINITTSSARSTMQDMYHRGITVMNRMGVHYYNTEAELDRFMDCLRSIANAGLKE